MKNLWRWSPFVVALMCTCVGAAEMQSLPVIIAGAGFTLVQDTSVAVLDIQIKPETLQLGSKGVFTATIALASNPDAVNIDIDTVSCEGAAAVRSVRTAKTLIFKFDRQDLQGLTPGEEVPLTVTGLLLDDRWFEGTDAIRIIAKPQPKIKSQPKGKKK